MSSNKKKNNAYDVGYGKPPVHTRFKRGQSGNPKGSAKGRKAFSDVLSKVMSETVVIIENGRRKSVTKLEASLKQLVNKAASGDARATKLLIELISKSESLQGGPQVIEYILPELLRGI